MSLFKKLFRKNEKKIDWPRIDINSSRFLFESPNIIYKTTGQRHKKIVYTICGELIPNDITINISPLQTPDKYLPVVKFIGDEINGKYKNIYKKDFEKNIYLKGIFDSNENIINSLLDKNVINNKIFYTEYEGYEFDSINNNYKKNKNKQYHGENIQDIPRFKNNIKSTEPIQKVYSDNERFMKFANELEEKNIIDSIEYLIQLEDNHIYKLKLISTKNNKRLVEGKEQFTLTGLTNPLYAKLQFIGYDKLDRDDVNEMYEKKYQLKNNSEKDDMESLNALIDNSYKESIEFVKDIQNQSILSIRHKQLENCIESMAYYGSSVSARGTTEKNFTMKDNTCYIRDYSKIIRDLDNKTAIGQSIYFLIYQTKKTHDFNDIKKLMEQKPTVIWGNSPKSYKTSGKIKKIYKRII